MKIIKLILFFTLIFQIINPGLGLCQEQDKFVGADQSYAILLGQTRALRDLAPVSAISQEKREAKKANKPSYQPKNFLGYDGPERLNPNAKPQGWDPVIQRFFPKTLDIMPLVVVDGINESETGGVGVPDVNGDKGRDQYIQVVNSTWVQIFNNDGSEMTTPFSSNVIWNEIGEQSFSDPVVHYDEMADRWLMTDLANIDQVLYAVSVTNDPLGSYYAYKFISPGLCDYPKYGISPGAYFFTCNEIPSTDQPVFAINRQQLLDGEGIVDIQRLAIPAIMGNFPTCTPVAQNGVRPAPANEFYAVRLNDDAWGNGIQDDVLEIWSMNIDWDDASNSTFELNQIPTQAFDADPCGGGQTCIPQQGTSSLLDAIATIIMNKVIYRNFGSHESIVLNFTVNPGNGISGIRWMELRRSPGTDWSVYQEGTLAPDDNLYRWMGAIAINGKGDIGMAYAVSGSQKYPSLRFTGRLNSDPLGMMTVNENEFATGENSRQFSNRYGDYFSMSVDPLTDAFWFTGEYVMADNSWGTKVMSFKLRRDTLDVAPRVLLTPHDGSSLSGSEVVSVRIQNLGIESVNGFKVGYIFEGVTFIDSVNVQLDADSTYDHVFGQPINVSLNGIYNIVLFTGLNQDGNQRNDTLRTAITNLANTDLGLIGFLDPPVSICADDVTLSVTAQNFGTDAVDSFVIGWQHNGGVANTLSAVQHLLFQDKGEFDIQIPNLTAGANDVKITIHSVNNNTDEYPANDTLHLNFDALLAGTNVRLELLLDGFPEETSWEMTDGQVVIGSGGPYPGQFNELIIEQFCLDTSKCYTFTIFDSYGDGLEGFISDGDYKIFDASNNVIASIMMIDFGDEESNTFCLNSCSLAFDVSINDASSMTAADGSIFISPTAGNPPFRFSIDGGTTFAFLALFENLLSDTYQVVVRDARGCEVAEEVEVSFNTGTMDLSTEFSVQVQPNPSTDGLFYLTTNGLSSQYEPLKIDILNASGVIVAHDAIPRLNQGHSGWVSLHKYPAGVYYLLIKNKNYKNLIRVIRL